jgi:hypothetical protein
VSVTVAKASDNGVLNIAYLQRFDRATTSAREYLAQDRGPLQAATTQTDRASRERKIVQLRFANKTQDFRFFLYNASDAERARALIVDYIKKFGYRDHRAYCEIEYGTFHTRHDDLNLGLFEPEPIKPGEAAKPAAAANKSLPAFSETDLYVSWRSGFTSPPHAHDYKGPAAATVRKPAVSSLKPQDKPEQSAPHEPAAPVEQSLDCDVQNVGEDAEGDKRIYFRHNIGIVDNDFCPAAREVAAHYGLTVEELDVAARAIAAQKEVTQCSAFMTADALRRALDWVRLGFLKLDYLLRRDYTFLPTGALESDAQKRAAGKLTSIYQDMSELQKKLGEAVTPRPTRVTEAGTKYMAYVRAQPKPAAPQAPKLPQTTSTPAPV